MPGRTPRLARAVALFAVFGSVATAEPGRGKGGAWVEPDPAAVVGRWTGTAVWKECAVEGPTRVALVVDRDGGGYRIDLAPALDGLGVQLMAPIGATFLEAVRDDLRAVWDTSRPGQASLRIALGSGCAGTLTLRRDTTRVAQCDELLALRAIASTCKAAPSDGDEVAPVEAPPAPPEADAAALDRLLAAGPRVRPAVRAAAEAACRRQTRPLRHYLIETGCLPAPIDPSRLTVRVPECDGLLAAVDRLMRCQRVPVETKQRLRVSMGRVDRWATIAPGDDEARRQAAETCEMSRVELVDTLTVLGC